MKIVIVNYWFYASFETERGVAAGFERRGNSYERDPVESQSFLLGHA